jgi:phosphonate degradation associated HDIG domain protein
MEKNKQIDELFGLLLNNGQADYIGEPISQIEHAAQAAALAEQANAPDDIVIAALLHDIGHLLPNQTPMGDYGNLDHETLGADYLKKMGFPDATCALIKGHVQAKRYLTYKYPAYHQKLSEASKATLVQQGGMMTEEEAAMFESDPLFEWHLKMRAWDELAKMEQVPLPDFIKYKNICLRLLQTTI